MGRSRERLPVPGIRRASPPVARAGAGRRAVAIMAKAPRPGTVKTRLCPPLTAAAAAELYRAFLLDKIAQVRRLPADGHVIAYTPAGGHAFFARHAPDFARMPQRGPDLGRRIVTSFERLFGDGYAGVLLIDSDTPTLPAEFLARALALIARPAVDLVLGPSEDGGYYLVGLRAPRPALFEDMPWSTPGVLSETLARARALGLRVARLPVWFDVDTGHDLDRLRVSLRSTAGPVARHTRRLLERWRERGEPARAMRGRAARRPSRSGGRGAAGAGA